MKTSELPLFEPKNSKVSIPINDSSVISTNGFSSGIYEQVNSYFQNQDLELKSIDFIREILGESANHIKDPELSHYATEVQFLIDEWADELESQIFGTPLRELLGIK